MLEPVLPVAFEWRKPHKRDGFDLIDKMIEGPTAPELVLLHHGRHALDNYAPLTDETGLFHIFVDTDPTHPKPACTLRTTMDRCAFADAFARSRRPIRRLLTPGSLPALCLTGLQPSTTSA
jgi:hypothetical protein